MAREPYVFDGKPELYATLRARIAAHFHIEPRAAIMVGSAHLGFSIAPDKRWTPFNESSDIDMVVISDRAFLEYWSRVAGYAAEPQTTSTAEAQSFKEFKWHHFNGRIRPDLLPMSLRTDWFDFFSSIPSHERIGLKVTGTIFYNDNFFEQYHVQNIRKLRAHLTLETKVTGIDESIVHQTTVEQGKGALTNETPEKSGLVDPLDLTTETEG